MPQPQLDLNQKENLLYWQDLHYIPEEQKNDPIWAAACLLFNKRNSKQLVTDEEAKKYRDIDDGILDAGKYKRVFDPIDPASQTGGTAEWLATDWKANPIGIHINNIVEANLEKIPINLFCKAIDEYAMLKQQKENQKILGRREFTKFINDINAQLGYPKLGKNEDPFRYAESMGSQKKEKPGKGLSVKDVPSTLMDSIKAAIDDNEDLALFNEYIYKGDVEIAIELGLKYYFEKNKFKRIGERIIQDIRRHNRGSSSWYTSKTTGRPQMTYEDPTKIFTSPFDEPDGKDIIYWWKEFEITFGEFVKRMGQGMTKEQLQKVFELNRNNMGAHGLDWGYCTSSLRNAARIRVGYCETESQNCDVYVSGEVDGNLMYRKKSFSWKPHGRSKAKRVEKHYNVWYKFYYIPLFGTDMNSRLQTSDFVRQSEYIFDFGKVQDQQRYGDDDRNSMCSLVVWKRRGMSFADIMDRFMPKIHLQWQKYQNYSSQNSEFVVYNNKMIEAMMQLSDEGDKGAVTDKMHYLRMIKQTGQGIVDFTDDKGNEIDPVKHYSTGQAKAALDCLLIMRELYNQLTTALAMSDVREGIDPKPRTSLGGIQLSLQASNNGTFFIEKGYMDMVIELSNRMLYYMKQIVEEGDSERLQEFKDVVGMANGLALEAIGDIPKHRLGLYIDNVNTDQQKQYLVQLADQMVKAGQLDIEALNLIIKIENYKYAAVMMIMKYKQKQRQLRDDEQRKQANLMQLKQMDLEIEKQKYISKEDAKTANIELGKKYDMAIEKMKIELRAHSQAMIKDMVRTGRLQENEQKSELEKESQAA